MFGIGHDADKSSTFPADSRSRGRAWGPIVPLCTDLGSYRAARAFCHGIANASHIDQHGLSVPQPQRSSGRAAES